MRQVLLEDYSDVAGLGISFPIQVSHEREIIITRGWGDRRKLGGVDEQA